MSPGVNQDVAPGVVPNTCASFRFFFTRSARSCGSSRLIVGGIGPSLSSTAFGDACRVKGEAELGDVLREFEGGFAEVERRKLGLGEVGKGGLGEDDIVG